MYVCLFNIVSNSITIYAHQNYATPKCNHYKYFDWFRCFFLCLSTTTTHTHTHTQSIHQNCNFNWRQSISRARKRGSLHIVTIGRHPPPLLPQKYNLNNFFCARKKFTRCARRRWCRQSCWTALKYFRVLWAIDRFIHLLHAYM